MKKSILTTLLFAVLYFPLHGDWCPFGQSL